MRKLIIICLLAVLGCSRLYAQQQQLFIEDMTSRELAEKIRASSSLCSSCVPQMKRTEAMP